MRKALRLFIAKIRELLAPLFRRYDQKLPYIITLLVALIVVVGGINVFIELTETLTTDTLADLDEEITQYVVSHRSPALNQYFLFLKGLLNI